MSTQDGSHEYGECACATEGCHCVSGTENQGEVCGLCRLHCPRCKQPVEYLMDHFDVSENGEFICGRRAIPVMSPLEMMARTNPSPNFGTQSRWKDRRPLDLCRFDFCRHGRARHIVGGPEGTYCLDCEGFPNEEQKAKWDFGPNPLCAHVYRPELPILRRITNADIERIRELVRARGLW